jgi:hypothetical protein
LISHGYALGFDAEFLTPYLITRIDSMVMRLAVVLLFLYSTPILSAVQPVPDEPDAARERLMSFIED